MVSLITEGSSTDPDGKRYPHRRATPWLVMVAITALIGAVVWIKVFTSDDASTAAMACNSPTVPASQDPGAPPPAPLGERVGSASVHDVEPAALSATKVRVFNANGERGQAAHVASELSDYGFASAPDVQVGNDPVYVDQNMQCSSQIRFGPSGQAAAATLQLAAPCAELIEDKRQDDTVDLALGTYFSDIAPNTDADEVLRSLKDPPPGVAPAPLDIKLLEAARTAKC
ncbi:envelope integrity protein Cei [Antrihabitans cavernicola]|uniref:LytR family transcriptional regulator n=1 Tax=Antrihabitans cavernicola TaxID=2495913 RepID=A0A5A7SDE4_9NOCA|nr:envelope integrity protein Cei [Spelaeibacter cavernicola]KAA0023399.1 LytR family transcriptional regulator [Spelaeibacter cavernicola]